MKTNILRIEPHRVMPDTKRENYGSLGGTILWKIWIGDELLTRNAHPFAKTDAAIDTHIDPNYPYWGESNSYMRVRLVGTKIIWTDLEIDDLSFRGSGLRPSFFVFDLEHYSQVCDAALAETGETNITLIYGRNHVTFQTIEGEEIKQLIQAFFPRHADEVAIYRQPSDHYDTTGMMLCRRIQKAIDETKQFKLCAEPEKTIELRIGLDMPKFIEAVWHVGRCEEGFAVYFEEYPYFPAWLYSENLSKVFEQEDFVKEL